MKKKILIVNANYYKEISLGLLKNALKQFPKNKDRFEFTLINEKEVGVSFERKF